MSEEKSKKLQCPSCGNSVYVPIGAIRNTKWLLCEKCKPKSQTEPQEKSYEKRIQEIFDSMEYMQPLEDKIKAINEIVNIALAEGIRQGKQLGRVEREKEIVGIINTPYDVGYIGEYKKIILLAIDNE